jgi:lipid II:glycine glycyltransferase (peptidoglycan interpeptide bridge formation enzyme)
MIHLEYSSIIDRNDWNDVLTHAGLANALHTPEYFETQTRAGHTLLYLCAYHESRPIGVISGSENRSGYHEGFIEIGSKSGGYPLLIDAYDQAAEASQIKNAFLEVFAQQYLKEKHFLLYPCFHLQECIFDDPDRGCIKQYDSTAFLDLTCEEELLWKGLRDKGRNLVRNARRKGVTTRIANDLQYFDKFYHFYQEVREKHSTQYMAYDELRTKFEILTQHKLADFWVAFLDETPLAYAWIWKYNTIINYLYNSSDPQYWSYKPNNLLQWEIISHYKQQGYTLYNMWGIRNMNLSERHTLAQERPIEGYGKFKLSFGAEVRELVRYVRI